MTNALESDLIRRAATGDRVAVTVLLTLTHERLGTHLRKRLPRDLQSTVSVDDLIQETQIQVFRHLDSFQPQGADSFYRWLATISLRRLRNAIKAHRAAKRGGGLTPLTGIGITDESVVALLDLMAGPEKSPSHHASRQEAYSAVEAALLQLPEHYRQAVRLIYLEGRSVADAAELMGRTPRAIHNLCHKAKEHLRGLLGGSSRFFSRSG